MNNVVYKTLREYLQIREDLFSVLYLKEKAFNVFNELEPLSEIASDFYLEYWSRLSSWSLNPEKHLGHLELQEKSVIKNAFSQLAEGKINRREFADMLSPSREFIDIYIFELKSMLDEKYKLLEDEYNNFAMTAGELSWVFQARGVKDSIMKFLMS